MDQLLTYYLDEYEVELGKAYRNQAAAAFMTAQGFSSASMFAGFAEHDKTRADKVRGKILALFATLTAPKEVVE
jgi:hypothetical protein